MSNPNVFIVQDLECSYDGKNAVLKIPRLEIPKGKFVCLVSVSGGGKSTFLEALGLMNNTLLPGSQILFYPGEDAEPVNFGSLWKDPKEKRASAIRSEHFSFIFQQTNLMPNFTAYENICLTQMLQGKSREESMSRVESVMKAIGLGNIDEDKKPWELSGGQQQRVAFARAISPEYTVIFGDEPTGNLDSENSHALMDLIRQAVIQRQKTAIIVSHDLEIIQKYADVIFVLTKENKVGEFRPENMYYAESEEGDRIWKDSAGNPVQDMLRSLKNKIKGI